jgi:arginase
MRGGLTFRDGHYICEAIHETGLLVTLDLMVRLSLPLTLSTREGLPVSASYAGLS